MAVMPQLEYKGTFSKRVGLKGTDEFDIAFNKPIEYFTTSDNYVKFIKACEQLVRKHEDYAAFKNYVMNVIGINFCQVTPEVRAEDAELEMHHAFFNLFDICNIITNKRLQCGEKVNTFRVANEVINEHFALHIPVVILAVTNHEMVTNRDIWLNIKSGFGNLSQFIEKYAPYLTDEQRYRIMTTIKLSQEIDSFDNHIFDDADKIKRVIRMTL